MRASEESNGHTGGHTGAVVWLRPAPALPAQPPAAAATAAVAVLDKLNRGVLLVDAAGIILLGNRAAQAMLAERGTLVVRRGRLEFSDRTANDRFGLYLANESDADGSRSLVLQVAAPRPRGAYRVLVSALDAQDDAGCVHCVFIYEPEAGHRPLPAKVLAQLYGLTPAEARLVNSLFVGMSLRAAAAQAGITLNTAKSTLKKVFAKCSVGSQAELLQLLALGPRTL